MLDIHSIVEEEEFKIDIDNIKLPTKSKLVLTSDDYIILGHTYLFVNPLSSQSQSRPINAIGRALYNEIKSAFEQDNYILTFNEDFNIIFDFQK